MIKEEVIAAIQILIEDREIEGEELELLNEAYQALPKKERIEVIQESIANAKKYVEHISTFNPKNQKHPTKEDIPITEIIFDLADEVSNYIVEDDEKYDLYSILRDILIETIPLEIDYIKSLNDSSLTINLERLKMTWASLLVEKEKEAVQATAFQAKIDYQSGKKSISELEKEREKYQGYLNYLISCTDLVDLGWERVDLLGELTYGSTRAPKSKIREELKRVNAEYAWQEAEVLIQKANHDETLSKTPEETIRTTRGQALEKQLILELQHPEYCNSQQE